LPIHSRKLYSFCKQPIHHTTVTQGKFRLIEVSRACA
jgi:hypothetical protein